MMKIGHFGLYPMFIAAPMFDFILTLGTMSEFLETLFIDPELTLPMFFLLVLSMEMDGLPGVAGMIITGYYGSFPKIPSKHQ